MRPGGLTTIALSLLVAGCATIPTGLPRPPSTDGISVRDLSFAIQCELAHAYYEINKVDPSLPKNLDSYAAGVKLELKVREQNVAGAAVKLLIPIVPVKIDSLSAGAGGTIDDTAYRYTTLNFNAAMADLRGKFLDDHNRPIRTCSPEVTGFSPASGNLGLGEWVAENVLALGPTSDAAALDNMTYFLEFILIRDVQGNIGFASNRVQSLGVTGDSKRTRDNTITVTIAKVQPKSKPEPQHVIIDNNVVVVAKDAPGVERGPRERPLTRYHMRPGRGRLKSNDLNAGKSKPKVGVSTDTIRRLELLNNQQKFNSVINPNSVIVPY